MENTAKVARLLLTEEKQGIGGKRKTVVKRISREGLKTTSE